MELYEGIGVPKSPKQAREFIIAGLRTLTDMDFCESVLQWGDPKCVADVYGIVFDGQPWFVKFRIDEDQVVEEISFHPPEKDLRTVAGKVISGGGSKRCGNCGSTETVFKPTRGPFRWKDFRGVQLRDPVTLLTCQRCGERLLSP